MFSAEYMAAAGAGECNHSLKHCHVFRSDSRLDANIHINYCVLFRISTEIFLSVLLETRQTIQDMGSNLFFYIWPNSYCFSTNFPICSFKHLIFPGLVQSFGLLSLHPPHFFFGLTITNKHIKLENNINQSNLL